MRLSFFSLLIFLFFINCNQEKKNQEPFGKDDLVFKWGLISLEATANDTERFNPRPTITSRFLALIWTAAFDAWSRFDDNAIPGYLKNVERIPVKERTVANKEIAISFAVYRTMMKYYYSDSSMLTNKMIEFGYNPEDNIMDPSTAIGIGNLAALSVIENRMMDGSNQTGQMIGSQGIPYSDYTGYLPINTPDISREVQRWQPKYFSDGKGGRFAPACLTPHWGKVTPLLLDSASQFRSPPPPRIGSEQLKREVKEVVTMQANLTNEQKALVEFMRDGPSSVQQAGHWLIFAQNVSLRDKYSLDENIKMYFLVTAAAMDAFIACWDTKMYYDFARPYALVHYYFKDKEIKGWAGPTKGMQTIKGQDWRPYSPETFLCPPFPSYVSGHSTISGACSEVLKFFTGNDFFGQQVKRIPGEMTEPEKPAEEVTLNLKTFTETANMAGISRVLGGYHIQSENLEGLKLGRKVAEVVWKKYLNYVGEKNK